MEVTKIEDIKDLKEFTGICLHSGGTKYWYRNGLMHRKDGPAIEYSDGTKYWYRNGKIHRGDGPAVEYNNGYKEWYLNNKEYTEQEYYKKMFKLGKITEEELFLVLL